MSEEQQEAVQIWVRTDKAVVYGPLTPTSIELLLDQGIIVGRVQVSLDGLNYVYPGRMPGIRVVFPRSLWGDTVTPGEAEDAAWSQVAAPLPLPGESAPAGGPGQAAHPPTGPSGVMAGPGTRPGAPARPGPALVAGPRARAQAQQRALNPAQVSAQARAANPSPQLTPPARPAMAAPARAAGNPSAGLFDNLDADMAPASSSQSGIRAAPASSSQSGIRAAPTPAGHAPPGHPSPAGHAPPAGRAPPDAHASPGGPAPPSHAATAGSRAATTSGSRSAVISASMDTGRIPTSGDLAQTTPVRLYFLAASQELTGLLSIALPDRVLQVHFRKGNPELIDSNHADDLLHNFLVRQQLASYDAIGQAEKQKERFGGELLAALFGLGTLNPATAFEKLAQRSTSILGRALLAEAGTFTWALKDLPASKSMPLGNKWAVFMEQLRHVPGVDARRRMIAAIDLPVMKSGGSLQASELRLTPQEARALTFFDGVRSLNQLSSEQPNEADVILRTAWVLRDCDLVSFASTPVQPPPQAAEQPEPLAAPAFVAAPAPAQPVVAPALGARGAPVITATGTAPGNPVITTTGAAVPGNPVGARPGNPASVPGNPVGLGGGPRQTVPYPGQKPSAPPAPVRPPPPVVAAPAPPPPKPAAPVITSAAAPVAAQPAPNFDQEITQLSALFQKMHGQNHFEVLELKRGADAAGVKTAYFKLARHYHPDTVPPNAPPALGKLKADIFARIGEANRTLSDAKLRGEYEAELDAGGTGEKVDISKILAAEEWFQKGQILVKARKFPEAIKMLDDAIAGNAEEGEYYSWRGFAKFFANTDKKVGQTEAMKDLNICLKKNPNVASTYYFMGAIAKLLGDLESAKKHFKKCVSLDEKHTDAQRELRLMK